VRIDDRVRDARVRARPFRKGQRDAHAGPRAA
jgi:hypothetical protein